MSEDVGTTVLRRYIGRRFVALRVKAGLTQQQAADALQRARATLGRIEDGDESVRFRDIEVEAMLNLYKADDSDRKLMLGLTAETRNGRKKGWWHDYTETELPDWFGLYAALEDSAEAIRHYEPEFVSGLLQTRAYAEQMTRMPTGYLTEEEIQRRVSVRMERQSLLTRRRAPHINVILNEAVIRRPVGGPAVMTDQLRHLLELMQQSNISVRVVPFSAGLHASCGSGFTVLGFPSNDLGDLLEPPLAYVDTLTGALYLNKPDEVHAYDLTWADLEGKALDEDKSRELITEAMEGFSRA